MSEHRLISETGEEARIASLIEPVVEELGLRLVRVRLHDHNGLVLQIMAERPDGSLTINECEKLSRAVSPLLDVADPIPQSFDLEISSPGIDRPLVRRVDFETWVGHIAKFEMTVLLEGRRRFRGVIVGSEADVLRLRLDDGTDVELPMNLISSARLVVTDDLVRETLKRDKTSRRGEASGEDIDLPLDN